MEIDDSFSQYANAQQPIEVTVFGIEIEDKLEHPSNVLLSIDFTPWGIDIEDRLQQLQYLQLVVCQSFLIKTVEK